MRFNSCYDYWHYWQICCNDRTPFEFHYLLINNLNFYKWHFIWPLLPLIATIKIPTSNMEFGLNFCHRLFKSDFFLICVRNGSPCIYNIWPRQQFLDVTISTQFRQYNFPTFNFMIQQKNMVKSTDTLLWTIYQWCGSGFLLVSIILTISLCFWNATLGTFSVIWHSCVYRMDYPFFLGYRFWYTVSLDDFCETLVIPWEKIVFMAYDIYDWNSWTEKKILHGE